MSVARYNIPVSVSPIRPFLCSLNLYKVDETSGGFPRLLIFGNCRETLVNQLVVIKYLFQAEHQREEIPVGSISANCVPRPCHIYNSYASLITQRKLARIQHEARELQTNTMTSVQKLAAFVGMMTAAKQVVWMARYSIDTSKL